MSSEGWLTALNVSKWISKSDILTCLLLQIVKEPNPLIPVNKNEQSDEQLIWNTLSIDRINLFK